jgi:hypothetical protein
MTGFNDAILGNTSAATLIGADFTAESGSVSVARQTHIAVFSCLSPQAAPRLQQIIFSFPLRFGVLPVIVRL